MWQKLIRSVGVLIIVALLVVGIEAIHTSAPAGTDDRTHTCPADAKICPDGSTVERTGPNCTFASCPSASNAVTTCTQEMKQADACIKIYQPVCGRVASECTDGTCDPTRKTFSNGCVACAAEHVVSYTAGACVTVDR